MIFCESMTRDTWRWLLGLSYIVAVAVIWIAASYIVQSVVDAGVSPFLVTYICNSLFLVYIPIVEITRFFEDSTKKCSSRVIADGCPNFHGDGSLEHGDGSLEHAKLLRDTDHSSEPASLACQIDDDYSSVNPSNFEDGEQHFAVENGVAGQQGSIHEVDEKGRWTRFRVAKISLFVCPFWFLGQLTFNLSLKYTTVTSNTILSSSSSLFTFFVSLAFLGEKFTWIKLISVLLCMGGTIIVSLSDSSSGSDAVAANPLLGDILALVSASLYASYITVIRAKLPDEDNGEGRASTAQFLGYLGLFNLLIFLPIAILLILTKLEPIHMLTWKQFGLIVGKGLLDNVLSDYLQVKATQLTSTTAATAGLSIQVPIAAIVDSLTGHTPRLLEYLGAASVMVGFVGINIPPDASSHAQEFALQHEAENVVLPTELELGRTIFS